MFLENNGFWGKLLRSAHLYGIPKVSEWVGSRVWARMIAWWVSLSRFWLSHAWA